MPLTTATSNHNSQHHAQLSALSTFFHLLFFQERSRPQLRNPVCKLLHQHLQYHLRCQCLPDSLQPHRRRTCRRCCSYHTPQQHAEGTYACAHALLPPNAFWPNHQPMLEGHRRYRQEPAIFCVELYFGDHVVGINSRTYRCCCALCDPHCCARHDHLLRHVYVILDQCAGSKAARRSLPFTSLRDSERHHFGSGNDSCIQC